jgi:hypothetical protein
MKVRRGGEGQRDNNEDYIDKDEDNYNIWWGSGPAKRCRAGKLITLVDNHPLDDNNLPQDSNEDKCYDGDNGGGGKMIKKKGQRLTSSGGKGIQDLLNTTATTTNLRINVKGEMQMMTSSMPQEEGGGDNS